MDANNSALVPDCLLKLSTRQRLGLRGEYPDDVTGLINESLALFFLRVNLCCIDMSVFLVSSPNLERR